MTRPPNPIPDYIRRGDTVAFEYNGTQRIVENISIFFCETKFRHYIKGIQRATGRYGCFIAEDCKGLRKA